MKVVMLRTLPMLAIEPSTFCSDLRLDLRGRRAGLRDVDVDHRERTRPGSD